MLGQKNPQNAVRAALTAHHPDLWRYALALTAQADAAEDLVQSTCLRAMEKAHTLKNTDHMRAWLMTLCRSVWLNERRASAIRRTESFDEGAHFDAGAVLQDGEANIFTRQVLQTVMGLPEAQREVVVLTYVLGYKYREVAEMLDIPVGTVMSRLSAARGRLHRILSDAPAEQGRA